MECEKNCQPSCELESYGRSLSLSQIENPSNEDGAKFAEFEIYFGEFQETRVTQMDAMSFDSVVSSIGGAMGVCLGASLISCIELFIFLCQLCMKIIWRPADNHIQDLDLHEVNCVN